MTDNPALRNLPDYDEDDPVGHLARILTEAFDQHMDSCLLNHRSRQNIEACIPRIVRSVFRDA